MRLGRFLSRGQVETIHRNALRVLEEVGVRVEHEGVRRRLTSVGGRCEDAADVVRFPAREVEKQIADAKKRPAAAGPPTVAAHVEVYESRYLDPATGDLVPFDEQRLAGYFGLARGLERVESVGMLGVPFVPEGMRREVLPLAEKLFSWKLGVRPGGGVQFTTLCEPLVDMFECHASATGRRLEEVFCAAGYLISPLRLARPECEQLVYFAGRGLRMYIGHMPSQGGTAPVTLAGAVVQALAEQMFLYLLARPFRDDAEFGVGGTVFTMDMRSGAPSFGRPEAQRVNLAFADLAAFYGCSSSGFAGLTDAKAPSYEAGAQKAAGAVVTGLAAGHASISAGLLAMDEICSPLQMVLDDELAGSLRAMFAGATINETECAFDEILAAGPGGSHMGTEFTAERCRRGLYGPRTWSAGSVSAWEAAGRKIDLDAARDVVTEFERDFVPVSHIAADEERELRSIIERAAANLEERHDRESAH